MRRVHPQHYSYGNTQELMQFTSISTNIASVAIGLPSHRGFTAIAMGTQPQRGGRQRQMGGQIRGKTMGFSFATPG
jgi:hypothetical protein